MVNKLAKKSIELTNKILFKKGVRVSITKILKDSENYHEAYSEDSITNRRFYNICAGGHDDLNIEHPYWTNLNLEGFTYIKNRKKNLPKVVEYDMLQKERLPIKDNSAEIIFSQYSVEHVTNDAADFFFRECYRALKDKGIIRIVTPNIELAVRAYNNKDKSYFYWMDSNQSLEQTFLAHFATNVSTLYNNGNPDKIDDKEFLKIWNSFSVEEALNYYTSRCKIDIQKEFKHRIDHINWWNSDKLINALTNAGFSGAYIAGPNQSSAHVFRNNYYFDNSPRNKVALFVEAVK